MGACEGSCGTRTSRWRVESRYASVLAVVRECHGRPACRTPESGSVGIGLGTPDNEGLESISRRASGGNRTFRRSSGSEQRSRAVRHFALYGP